MRFRTFVAFPVSLFHLPHRFVRTCITTVPSGSADFASMRASDVAISVLAGVTARIRQVSRSM